MTRVYLATTRDGLARLHADRQPPRRRRALRGAGRRRGERVRRADDRGGRRGRAARTRRAPGGRGRRARRTPTTRSRSPTSWPSTPTPTTGPPTPTPTTTWRGSPPRRSPTSSEPSGSPSAWLRCRRPGPPPREVPMRVQPRPLVTVGLAVGYMAIVGDHLGPSSASTTTPSATRPRTSSRASSSRSRSASVVPGRRHQLPRLVGAGHPRGPAAPRLALGRSGAHVPARPRRRCSVASGLPTARRTYLLCAGSRHACSSGSARRC